MICSRQVTVCLLGALLLGLPPIGLRPVLAAPSRSANLNAEAATHSVARKMRQTRKKPVRPPSCILTQAGRMRHRHNIAPRIRRQSATEQ